MRHVAKPGNKLRYLRRKGRAIAYEQAVPQTEAVKRHCAGGFVGAGLKPASFGIHGVKRSELSRACRPGFVLINISAAFTDVCCFVCTRSCRCRPASSAELLRACLLWLTGFSGAFVFIEPSPYVYVATFTVLLFALTGMSMRGAIVPLIALLLLMLIGYGIAVVPVSDQSKPVTWVLISIFMAVTAVFYAAMLGTNTQSRLETLLRGYVAAAVVASLVAIGGYFLMFGSASEMLVLYDRARGTFNDPNVLGAFLVLPGLLLLQRMLAGHRTMRSGVLLLVMLAALFLTFSRGAWAQFAFAAMLLMYITFITSASVREKFRIVVVALAGLAAVAVLITALLSFGQVSDIFSERAALEQSYDVGRFGRFGRYLLGVDIALEHPLGIGPLQFYL